jgi:hypothetical protein
VNISKLAWALFAVVALGGGCASSVSSRSGSNSNWLESCSKDADCGGGFKCWCGTCTSPCTSSTDCTTLASGATCADSTTGSGVCGGAVTTTACVLACTKPADCASLGDRATCSNGACRKAPAKIANDSGSLTCAERITEATTQTAAIVAKADTTCATDNDCVASSGVSCGVSACGEPSLSKAGAAAIAPTLASLDQRLCAPFTAAGCASPVTSCPAIYPPMCDAHVCKPGLPMVFIEGGVPAPPDAGNLTCSQRLAQMDDLIHADWDHARGPCAVDADCTVVAAATGCDAMCPTAATKAAAQALAADLQAIESRFCPSFLDAGCTFVGGTGACLLAPPGMDAGIPIKCVAGFCQGVE